MKFAWHYLWTTPLLTRQLFLLKANSERIQNCWMTMHVQDDDKRFIISLISVIYIYRIIQTNGDLNTIQDKMGVVFITIEIIVHRWRSRISRKQDICSVSRAISKVTSHSKKPEFYPTYNPILYHMEHYNIKMCNKYVTSKSAWWHQSLPYMTNADPAVWLSPPIVAMRKKNYRISSTVHI